MSTPRPTGRREAVGGRDSIVLERTFRAPVAGVWADVPAEPFTIHRCDPPHLLEVSSPAGENGSFELVLALREDAGTTTLTFSQAMGDPALAADVGPGWEYYLDRLVAAERREDVGAIDFDDYHPAQCDHYRELFTATTA